MTSAKDTVRLTLEDGTAIASGALAVAEDGIATFPAVSITRAKATARIIATSTSLSATSDVFTVTPATPTLQASTIGPVSMPVTAGVVRNLTLTFSDAFGNRIAAKPISITASLAGVTVTPNQGTTTSAGTFAIALNATEAGSTVLTAVIGGASIAFAPIVVQLPCTPSPIAVPGTASGVLPTESCTIAGLSTLLYSFTMTAPGAARFSLNAPFQSVLDVNTVPPVTAMALRGSGAAQTGEWLLPPGTYTARVSAVSGGGEFALTSAPSALNQGQVIRNIVVPGAYDQMLGDGDFVLPDLFGDNSFWDIFQVRFDGPCTITARPTSVPALDLLLIIADSVENPLFADDDSGGGTDPQLSLPECQFEGGPIRIMINHYLDVASGPYSLMISFSAAGATVPSAVTGPASWAGVQRQLRLRKGGSR